MVFDIHNFKFEIKGPPETTSVQVFFFAAQPIQARKWVVGAMLHKLQRDICGQGEIEHRMPNHKVEC